MFEQDWPWMQHALRLAERGRGFVEPNPLVGAVVVRDGQRVGEGWHQKFGAAHAEVNALNQAGELARGATLYVTLEPCCHHGKTPPCTDTVIRFGVRRVVAAMSDPFPKVAGRGAELLRAAGIDVSLGVGETEAHRLNAPYLMLLASGRPYIHAKWAMTLDGKIATRSGHSQWISNEASRRRVHELRGRMDAILVGIGTVIADDPMLTARPPGPRVATRIVLDRRGRTPTACQLVQTALEVPTVIVIGPDAPAADQERLCAEGCEILPHADLGPLIDELGRRRMTNVLVEGGAEVLGSFVDADAVDEFHVFIAPKVVGGQGAKSPVAGLGVETMADSRLLADWQVELVDGDVLLHGRRRHQK